MLHKQQSDIAYLQVFECAAYIHIPEDVRTNKMAPKSELMVYLGVAPRNISNFLFIWSPKNVLFTSAHVLFNKLHYPCYVFFHTCPIAQPVPPNSSEHLWIRPFLPTYDDHLPNWPAAQALLPLPISPPCMPSPCLGIPLSLTLPKLRPGAPPVIPPAPMYPAHTHYVPK